MRVPYIKQRRRVYWFQRRPSKNLHKKLGSKLISINLHTESLAVAIKKRDEINASWNDLVTVKSGVETYKKTLSVLKKQKDLTDEIGYVNEELVNLLSESKVNTQHDAQKVISNFSEADQAAFWAWRKATANESPPDQYQYSIRDALKAIVNYKRDSIAQIHLDKYKLSVDLFVGEDCDRSLESIRKGEVVEWIDDLRKSASTKSTYLSCLGGIFDHAQIREHINDQKINPFRKIPLGKKDVVHYKFMEDDLLVEILSKLSLTKHKHDALIANLARSTGVRLGDLFKSKVETHEGIVCLNVLDAKTPAGVRLVPIPDRLIDEVVIAHPSWIEKGCSSDYSKRFGRAKRSVVTDKGLAFHSLRVTFITWAGNTEERWSEQHIAWLVGHEEGKGDAMTGQLYFKGYSLPLMKKIIESVKPFKFK